MGRQGFVVGIAADVDARVAGVADQLRLQVVVALQLLVFALRLDFGFGGDDPQYRQRLYIVSMATTGLRLGPYFIQTLTDFQRVGLGDEDQLGVFGGKLAPAPGPAGLDQQRGALG